MHRGYSTSLVIAIMAFAVVAFLFMIDTAINPDGSKKSTNTTVTNTSNNTKVPAKTNTLINSNVNSNTDTATPEVLPDNVKRFTSSKLGITFTYLTTGKDYKATVQEIDDKVYINVNVSTTNPITNGQWVQVFAKDPADSLTQAITKKFLSGISAQDCFVTIQSRTNISSTQSAAIIDWPATLIDENNPFGDNSKCPKEYQKTNGERYFLVDSQDATKLLFFSIGQYAIMGLNDDSTTWQQTLRMTKADPTAGWNTFTNTEYNFSIKYPESYTASELNTVGKKTPEHITFFQGKSLTTSTRSIAVYSLTKANTSSDTFSGEVVQWYDWAISGFPSDTVIGRLSENKRQETYGQNTFTVINYDPGSSWSGSPLYYLVSGETVYILADFYAIDNKPKNDPDIVQQMLSTLTLSD